MGDQLSSVNSNWEVPKHNKGISYSGSSTDIPYIAEFHRIQTPHETPGTLSTGSCKGNCINIATSEQKATLSNHHGNVPRKMLSHMEPDSTTPFLPVSPSAVIYFTRSLFMNLNYFSAPRLITSYILSQLCQSLGYHFHPSPWK